jgi:hypothetical protein
VQTVKETQAEHPVGQTKATPVELMALAMLLAVLARLTTQALELSRE